MATASARRCCAVCGVLPYIEEREGVLGGEVRVGGGQAEGVQRCGGFEGRRRVTTLRQTVVRMLRSLHFTERAYF